MLTKRLLLGFLAALLCLSFTGAVFACDYNQPKGSSDEKTLSMNSAEEAIDFDYSPRMGSSTLASAPSMSPQGENIEFDYSPRINSSAQGSFSAINMNEDNIEFDYSPRTLMCEGASC